MDSPVRNWSRIDASLMVAVALAARLSHAAIPAKERNRCPTTVCVHTWKRWRRRTY
jgi:hypothetical protein